MKKTILTVINIFLIAVLCHAQTEAVGDTVQTADSVQIGNLTEFSVGQSLDNVTKQAGDSAYMREDYNAAIQIYEALLKKGEAMELYYNLGNSYYKENNYAKAILNYERALLLSPGNSDVRFNLELARSKTIDQETTAAEMFFVTWTKALVNKFGVDAWARCSIIMFILTLVCASIYLFMKDIRLRKAGFLLGIVFMVMCILSNVFANSQKGRLQNRNDAIIMQPSVTVRSTPSESGTSLFVIHEGHKASITDDSMHDWKEITLEDGKVGWVPTESIERI